MLAGGSGITPMYQILADVQRRGVHDQTRVTLLYANQTEADILLRKELEELGEKRSLTNIVLSVDRPSEQWKGPSGFITPDLIKTNFPAPAKDVLILLCGPPPMIAAMEKHLLALGYTDDMLFKF
jgi:cytochrome-b5 reductase